MRSLDSLLGEMQRIAYNPTDQISARFLFYVGREERRYPGAGKQILEDYVSSLSSDPKSKAVFRRTQHDSNANELDMSRAVTLLEKGCQSWILAHPTREGELRGIRSSLDSIRAEIGRLFS